MTHFCLSLACSVISDKKKLFTAHSLFISYGALPFAQPPWHFPFPLLRRIVIWSFVQLASTIPFLRSYLVIFFPFIATWRSGFYSFNLQLWMIYILSTISLFGILLSAQRVYSASISQSSSSVLLMPTANVEC